jgi:Protein of unknown function (DUF3592)
MRSKHFLSIAMFALLVFLGGKGLVWVVGDTRLALDSKSWQWAPAVVQHASLEESTGAKGVAEYSPDIRYRFHVNGREYVGTRLEIPRGRSGSEEAERNRLESYAPGTTVQILYDPLDPTRSVVLRPSINYWFTLGMGLLSLGLIVASLYLGFAVVAEIRKADDSDANEEPEPVSAAGKAWSSIANRLDVIVIVLLVALAWGVKRLDKLGFGGTVYNVAVVVTLVAILVTGCVIAMRKQKRVAETFGLVCKHCGHSPRAASIPDTELRGECLKCGKPLSKP